MSETSPQSPMMKVRAGLGRCSHCWGRGVADVELSADTGDRPSVSLKLCHKHREALLTRLFEIRHQGQATLTDGSLASWAR